MGVTWILVADNSRARLFRNVGPGKNLEKIRELDYPAGRQHRRDNGTEDMEIHNPEEANSAEWAGRLSTLLHEGRVNRQFEKLILVASPKFLGALRGKLDKATHALVTATLDKDYLTLSDDDLVRQLDEAFYTF